MKFACIEYTTKNGVAWRHTPARPNYFCDPEREIDPTSFGCYTSALAGEHLPLTGLVYGSLERRPSALRRLPQDLTRKFRGGFRPYDLSYLSAFDVLLVVYQLSNDDELVRLVERVRTELPRTTLVSCSSPPFGRLREHWKDHPETAARYRAFLDASHVNMNVCRATVPYYRHLSRTPSLYLPQPYPVEYALQQARGAGTTGNGKNAAGDAEDGRPAPAGEDPSPAGRRVARAGTVRPQAESEGDRRSEQTTPGFPSGPSAGWAVRKANAGERLGTGKPILYVAGDTVRPDILTGHLVAKALQARHPEILIRITKTPEFSLNTEFLKGTRFEVVPFRPWAEQLRELARVRLVLNTDLWWTRGRVPVDCAAAGVPCVGTTSDGQTELWPDLAVSDPTEVDRLVELAERALTDEGLRAQTTEKAQARLRNYSYDRTAERLTRAVALARAGRLADWRDPSWDGNQLVIGTS